MNATYRELERIAKQNVKFLRFTRDDAGEITGAWCNGAYYTVPEFPPEISALRIAAVELQARGMKK